MRKWLQNPALWSGSSFIRTTHNPTSFTSVLSLTMVLKRKQGDEFVPWTSSSQGQQDTQSLPELSPPKRTRRSSVLAANAIAAHSTMTVSTPIQRTKTRTARGRNSSTAIVPTVSAPIPPAIAGPSVYPQAGSSQPSVSAPAKRGRKKKAVADSDEPEPEKRRARFKPSCPQNIMDRVERVRSQRCVEFVSELITALINSSRICLIDRTRNEGEMREQFSILGSTANVRVDTRDFTFFY